MNTKDVIIETTNIWLKLHENWKSHVAIGVPIGLAASAPTTIRSLRCMKKCKSLKGTPRYRQCFQKCMSVSKKR